MSIDSQLIVLFERVFQTKGRYSWSTTYKRQYLYELRAKNKLSNRVISESLHQKPIDEIKEIVFKIDTGLKIFKKYHQRFEQLGRKLVELISFDDFTHEELEYIQKELKVAKYDFSDKEEWEPVNVSKNDNIVKITLAKSALEVANTKLSQSDLSDEQWEVIQSKAIEKSSAAAKSLIELTAKLICPKRTIITFDLDLDNNVLSVSRDNFQVDVNGKRVAGSNIEKKERDQAIGKVAEILHLDKSADSFIHCTHSPERNLVNTSAMEKLQRYNKADLLIVQLKRKYDRKDESIEEYEETATIHQPKQRELEIVKKAEEYYDKNGMFDGFFEEHFVHDTTKPKYTSTLEDDENAIRKNFHAIAIAISEQMYYKKSKDFQNKLRGKQIEFINYIFDIESQNLEIINKNYSKTVYDILVQQILESDSLPKN